MNISRFGFILFNLKIFDEIVTPIQICDEVNLLRRNAVVIARNYQIMLSTSFNSFFKTISKT